MNVINHRKHPLRQTIHNKKCKPSPTCWHLAQTDEGELLSQLNLEP